MFPTCTANERTSRATTREPQRRTPRASRPASVGGAPRKDGGAAASATHACGSDAEGQLAGIAARTGSPCSSVTTEANSETDDPKSPCSCICTNAPGGLSPSARATAFAGAGRSTAETISHDHRGSREPRATRGESRGYANERRTVSRLAEPSLGRSAATSAVSASSQATRRGTSSSRSRTENVPPAGLTTTASSFTHAPPSSPPPTPWCRCDASFAYSSSSSSSATSSTVSSHSVARRAEAIASRPSDRSAKTASPRGTKRRAVFVADEKRAAFGVSFVRSDGRIALAGQKQTSATVAGNATVAAHMGGGNNARAKGVTRTSAPSTVALVAADDTTCSSSNTCSSTRPAGVTSRSTFGFVRSQAQCTFVPSRVGKRISRARYHLPFPRRQICVAAPKTNAFCSVSPSRVAPSARDTVRESKKPPFEKASGSVTHTASRSESHDHASDVTSTPAPRRGK